MAQATHDLAIKTGEYQDPSGQTKARWQRIGTVFRHDGVHRPSQGKCLAPACRAPGNGKHRQTFGPQPVQGAQPTGALVTFPNAEVLRSSVVNYTREFPWVWDEVVIPLASESDLGYAAEVLVGVAQTVVGETMERPASIYRQLLGASRLDLEVAPEPQVFFSQGDSWTNATIRYLVDARRRRITASRLLVATSRELARHAGEGRLVAAYPITRVALVDPNEFPGA
jgi:hypothetical protein